MSPVASVRSMRVAGARTFVPALDGIRGIAILFVTAFHFVSQAAQVIPRDGLAYSLVLRTSLLGTNGVDLFFVLSGFLITGLLLDSKSSAHYFRNFYARRTLRIFPLYYGFLIALLVVAPLVLPGSALVRDAGLHSSWVWVYASNVKIALDNAWVFCGGARCGQGIELTHTWSLAVEEHFYLVWPLVVFLTSRRGLARTCLALMVVSLAFRIGLRDRWFAMYAFTPCRLDALALGAFVAAAVRGPGIDWLVRVGRWPAALAGVLFAAVIALPGGQSGRAPVVQALSFTLSAVVCAALIVATLISSSAPGGRGPLARALSGKAIRTIGKYSYGLYLFHSAMRPVFMRIFPAPRLAHALGSGALGLVAYDVLATLASLAMAWVSYQAFEKHFLRWKDFFSDGRTSPRALDMEPSPDTIR